MDPSGLVDHGEDFQFDPEFTHVVQQTGVMVGNPPRTGVEVEVAVHPDVLHGAVGFFDLVTIAKRDDATSGTLGGLQNLHLVTGFVQFIGGHHSGDPGTEYEDLLAFSALERGGRELGRCRLSPKGAHCLGHHTQPGSETYCL